MTKKTNLLLIEDNPVDARLIQELLSEFSQEYNLEQTQQLSDGLKRLSEYECPIDTVLLDLSLPDSHGLETFEKVHSLAPRLPIIIITSLDDEKISEEAVNKGAQDYLIKGQLNSPLLIRAIRYAFYRKQAEQRISETFELNQKILAASASGTITYKASGQCVFANEAAGKILNASISELLSQNYHTIESWKKYGLYTIAQKVLKTKKSYQKEIYFASSFGKTVWLDCFLATFTIADENHLLVIFDDISERKKIEEALNWQQYLMQTLLDNYPDAIYFKDAESRIIELSKALAEKLGFVNPNQVIGKTDFELFSKEHAQKAFDDEQKIIKTGKPLYNIEEKETYPDKPPTWVITSKMPLLDQHHNIIGTFGISQDITERKRAEDELHDSQQRYQSLFEDSPTPIWEEDFSEVKKEIDILKKKGITDF